MPFPEGRLLRLPGETLLRLELHLDTYYRGTHFEDHLNQLMTEWLKADVAKFDAQEASTCTHGYQWKDVFLVDRTLLRTVIDGKNHIAEVQYDFLVYNRERTTPSRFANGHGKTGRNAWECIWVQRPGSQLWVRARELRERISGRRSKSP